MPCRRGLRRAVRGRKNRWTPATIHEFEESAILKVFGQADEDLFAAPTAIESEVAKQYSVRVVGRIAEVKERLYAISVERRLKHPAVVTISNVAQNKLFASDPD